MNMCVCVCVWPWVAVQEEGAGWIEGGGEGKGRKMYVP